MFSALCLCIFLSLSVYAIRAAQQDRKLSSVVLTGVVACVFFIGFAVFLSLDAFTLTAYVMATLWAIIITSKFESIW